MRINIEALIELTATKARAEHLAGRIKNERGLEAVLGMNAASGYSRFKSRMNPTDIGGEAQRKIIVRGESDSYHKAERVIGHLKNMLRRYDARVNPMLAAVILSDEDENTSATGEYR